MQIAYVNIFVSDLTQAIAFYHEKLGLHLQFSSSEHGYASLSAGAVRHGIAVPGQDEAQLIDRHTGVGLKVTDRESGIPAQNACFERFNRTFREEVPDLYLFRNLSEVCRIPAVCLQE
jgi:catechol 2,3-dioxygenase-like lactoylglutathione lyase family enzyme